MNAYVTYALQSLLVGALGATPIIGVGVFALGLSPVLTTGACFLWGCVSTPIAGLIWGNPYD